MILDLEKAPQYSPTIGVYFPLSLYGLDYKLLSAMSFMFNNELIVELGTKYGYVECMHFGQDYMFKKEINHD